jgi:UDP-N-acetylmuramate dehydrogenase
MKTELEQRIGAPVLENEPMKNHTTFRVGGPAKYFVAVDTKEKLFKAVKAAQDLNLPFFLVGGGSNMLVSDSGIDGLVINLLAGAIDFEGNNIVRSFAGNNLGKVIRTALEKNLGGMEFAGNIPGSIGGAVWGNAGAFGKGVGDFVKEVEVITRTNNEVVVKKLDKASCEFSYRESVFKKNPDWIISEVVLELSLVENPEEKIKEIANEQDGRCAKQPLQYPSAGCTFKNLIYSDEYVALKEWAVQGKLPAARFIDELGLKGTKIGGAMISDKHANFIINVGDATASDIVQLISLVKGKVRDRFNVQLEEEVQYLGF